MRRGQVGAVMSESGRRTVALVDAAALRANLAAVRAGVAPNVAVLAAVKADGYGHGASLVAPVLADAGTDLFGVATIEEGIELREAGITQPVLVLAGAVAGDLEAAVANRLSVALLDSHMARSFAAALKDHALPVHVKLDTGMTRLGVTLDGLPELIDTLRRTPQLRVEGVFSHFGDADSVSTSYADLQLRRFEEGVRALRASGFEPRWLHLANSVATLTRQDTHCNLVRPGIVLYGIAPAGADGKALQPVMQLQTRVWQVKSVPAGCPVSYGQTFVTRRPSCVGVLPIGYADGYSRALSNRGQVLIRGQRVPVIGQVCMDVTMIDVTDVPGAAPGDEVVLWGRQGSASLSVCEVAGWQDSIPYEVLTRVGKRVPRVLR